MDDANRVSKFFIFIQAVLKVLALEIFVAKSKQISIDFLAHQDELLFFREVTLTVSMLVH